MVVRFVYLGIFLSETGLEKDVQQMSVKMESSLVYATILPTLPSLW